MATACWAFIVAKSTPVETASLLGFCGVARLQHENSSTSYAQAWVHRLWTSWRPAEVPRNAASTQRFQPRLYRFGNPGRGQISGGARGPARRADGPAVAGLRTLFAGRTRLLPDEKTRRPTRLSGSFRTTRRELVTARWSPIAQMPITRQAGAAGRNRTCDPLLRREMLYPLSYSRAVDQCIKGRGPSRAGQEFHGRTKPTKLHKFQACEDTLYRSASPILSLVRRRHGDDADTSLEAGRRQTWVRNSRLQGCWPSARSPVH